MLLDAFLTFQDTQAGTPAGETRDETFKEAGAMEINSFELKPLKKDSTFGLDLAEDDGDDGKQKKKKQKKNKHAGKHSFTASFDKELDSASPDLLIAYCRYLASPEKCKSIKQVHVSVRKAGAGRRLVFLEFLLKEVYVISYKLSADDGGKPPKEDIELGFEYCQIIYRPQKPDGTLGRDKGADYDFRKNESTS